MRELSSLFLKVAVLPFLLLPSCPSSSSEAAPHPFVLPHVRRRPQVDGRWRRARLPRHATAHAIVRSRGGGECGGDDGADAQRVCSEQRASSKKRKGCGGGGGTTKIPIQTGPFSNHFHFQFSDFQREAGRDSIFTLGPGPGTWDDVGRSQSL